VVDGPGELRQRFCWCPGGVAELRRRRGRPGQPDHVAAAVGPRLNQRAPGGGFPAPVPGDGQLQPRPGGAHGTNQSGLSGIQADPFAADSSRASYTVAASTTQPSVRPAAATRRCSASRIRAEVNNSDLATM
jgi:hypothetical protein